MNGTSLQKDQRKQICITHKYIKQNKAQETVTG
jgi:hypothetical protein